MSIDTRRTPERNNPLFSGLVVEKAVVTSNVLSTAGGVETMTVAEVLGGLLIADTQDAQTWTTPTAAQLNAAIPGVEIGSSFEFDVVNYGDSTLTIGLGTGVTKVTLATVAAVMTIATLTGKRFRLVCTGVADPSDPSKSASWNIYTVGASAALVA